MSSHILFDKPDIDQDKPRLLLLVDGTLPNGKPGLAYEGRLQIHNNIGDCTVRQIGGAALPPGSTISVDNTTSQVVVAWPAYDSGIANADFEQGSQGWELGFGWEVGATSPPTPAPESGGQCAKYLRKGEAYIRRASWDTVTPGQSLTARARINPVNKRSGSQARVNIEWYDGSRTMISRAVGSLVEYGDEWEWSAVTSANPGNAEFAKISVLGQHSITGRNGWQTRPVLLDRVEWNYPSSGVNADAVYCIILRVRDSAGREADWSGCITVVNFIFSAPLRFNRRTATAGLAFLDPEATAVRATAYTHTYIRSDTWFTSGDWYWEMTSGFTFSSQADYAQAALVSRVAGVQTVVGSLVQHTDNTGGPGNAAGALLVTQQVVAGWPNPTQERIRNRLTFTGGGATWQAAVGAGPWITLATNLPGEIAVAGYTRGATGSAPAPEVRSLRIFSQPDTVLYDVPDGAACAAGGVTPYGPEKYPQIVAVTQYSDATSATSHAVPIPAGAAGDLIVLLTTKRTPSSQNIAVSGYTQIFQGNMGPDPQSLGYGRCAAWYKVSDGTETSASVSTGTRLGPVGAVVVRVQAGTFLGAPVGASQSDSLAPIDPPSFPTATTPWGSDPVLNIAVFGHSTDSIAVTGLPFPDNQQVVYTGGSHPTILGVCTATLQTPSVTPGPPSLSGTANGWTCAVVQIQPSFT